MGPATAFGASPTVTSRRFSHTAFVYETDQEYVGAAVEFLRAGLEAGEGALIASPRDRQALLRGALGPLAERIAFLDLGAVDRPAQAVAVQYAAVSEQLRRFPALRLVVGVDPGPPDNGRLEWRGYEAALERTLGGLPVRALTAYDARCAAVEILRGPSPEPQPLPGLRTIAGGADPEALREQLGAALAAEGVAGRRALEALLAANEVIVNALRHGEPPVELRLGREGGRVVCEVIDRGPGFEDPLAGFDPPEDPGSAPGLWVVRQLVRNLEAFRSPAGFTVRLWL